MKQQPSLCCGCSIDESTVPTSRQSPSIVNIVMWLYPQSIWTILSGMMNESCCLIGTLFCDEVLKNESCWSLLSVEMNPSRSLTQIMFFNGPSKVSGLLSSFDVISRKYVSLEQLVINTRLLSCPIENEGREGRIHSWGSNRCWRESTIW